MWEPTLTEVRAMADLGKHSGAEVSTGGPVWPAAVSSNQPASPFPPDRLVRELLDRWWSLHVGSRGSSHSIGGLSGADLRNSVNLALLRARRLARVWHPGIWSGKGRPTGHQLTCPICNGWIDDQRTPGRPLRWTAECPIERFYRARDRVSRMYRKASEATVLAAGYQLRRVRLIVGDDSPHSPGWDPRQHPTKDTGPQKKARRLWDRADALWDACNEAEQDPAFDLVVRFLAAVLEIWSVQEDPELFSRYAIP